MDDFPFWIEHIVSFPRTFMVLHKDNSNVVIIGINDFSGSLKKSWKFRKHDIFKILFLQM